MVVTLKSVCAVLCYGEGNDVDDFNNLEDDISKIIWPFGCVLTLYQK